MSRVVIYEGQDSYLTSIQVPDAATIHNNIYRGKKVDLEKALTSIQNGSFDDLYIGDYFELNIDSDPISFENNKVDTAVISEGIDKGSFRVSNIGEPYKFVFLGFDSFLGTGNVVISTDLNFDAFPIASINPSCLAFDYKAGSKANFKITKHHAVVMPTKPMFDFGMNNENKTDLCFNTAINYDDNLTMTTDQGNGYIGCRLRNSILPELKKKIMACSGGLLSEDGNKGHILTHREFLAGKVGTAASSTFGSTQKMPTSYYWVFSDLEILSEIETMGTRGFGNAFEIGTSKYQFPYFKFAATRENTNNKFIWLRTVASSTHFSLLSGDGICRYVGAKGEYGVRPRFLIG